MPMPSVRRSRASPPECGEVANPSFRKSDSQNAYFLSPCFYHSQAVVLLSPPGDDDAAGIAGLFPLRGVASQAAQESRSVAVERTQGNVGPRGTNWPSFPVVLRGGSADDAAQLLHVFDKG